MPTDDPETHHRNCVTCIRKEKADPKIWDTNGGDFWRCTAEPIYPAFVGYMEAAQLSKVARLLNLKLFDDGTTYANGLKRDCPLWEGDNAVHHPTHVHSMRHGQTHDRVSVLR